MVWKELYIRYSFPQKLVTLKLLFMKRIAFYSLLCLLMVSFSSCAFIGGIFKAGVWVGVLIVVAIIGVIVFIASRGSKK